MAVEYTYDEEAQIVHARPTGVLDPQQIIDYFERLTADDSVLPGFFEVVDFTELADIQVSFSQTTAMRLSYGILKKSKKVRASLLIGSDDFRYGMARMLVGAFGDEHLGFAVRTMEEAMQRIEELRQ